MFDIGVRKRDRADPDYRMMLAEIVCGLHSEASGPDILFHRDDQAVAFRKLVQQGGIDRLDKTGIGQGTGMTPFLQGGPDMLGGADGSAGGKEGNFLFAVNHFAPAVLDRSTEPGQALIGRAARIADGDGTAEGKGKFQLVFQLVQILRSQHGHARDAGKEGKIENSLMGFSVFPDQTGMVDGKDHRQLLKADIVYNLIESPLQEG